MIARRALLAAGLLAAPAWAAAPAAEARPADAGARMVVQEADRDSVPADTAGAREATGARSDTATAPSDTAGAVPDTTRRLRSLPHHPAGRAGFAVRRVDCDRDCLLDHNALVLMDLLEMEMPGLTMLRGSYFAGPHYLLSGPAGPGFVEWRMDGRPVPPLAGGQAELTRLPVTALDRLVVTETPRGVVLDASPVRRTEPRAYSRINAATGSPDVNRIHALFTNGLGDHFEVSTGIDLLNTTGPGTGGDRFDFWGRLAWLPGEGRGGLELQWRNQSLDRRGLDTASVDRREVHVVGRGALGDALWLTVTAGNSRRERAASSSGPGSGGEGEAVVTEVDAASAGLTLGKGTDRLEAELEARDGPGQPTLRSRLAASSDVLEGLTVTGGVTASRWEGFDGWSGEAGLGYRPGLGVGLELGVGAATGVRGVPRPLEDRADSLSFVQAQGRVGAAVGPVSLSVRGHYQELSRRLPFAGPLDPVLSPGPGVTVGAVEGTLEAPLLPMTWLLGQGTRPVRLVGTWRHQEVLDEGAPLPADSGAGPAAPADLYLPAEQARVAAVFQDRFFQGDLEVRAVFAVRHRSTMTTLDPLNEGVGTVPGWTTGDWNLMLQIKDVRIWWRVDNTRNAPWEDLVGVTRPVRRNVFGVKWEFFN